MQQKYGVLAGFSSPTKKNAKSPFRSFDHQKQAFNLKGDEPMTDRHGDQGENISKTEEGQSITEIDNSNEQEKERASDAWKSEALVSKGAENVLDPQFNTGSFQLQVYSDDFLPDTAKLILFVWSLAAEYDRDLSEIEGKDVFIVRPIASKIFGQGNISKTTYYRHLKTIEQCDFVEIVGEFEYKAEQRMAKGKTYKLKPR